MKQSMGRTETCRINGVIEIQWSILKSELYDQHECESASQAISGVEELIYSFHTVKRLNLGIGYQTIVDLEAHHQGPALEVAA